MPKLLYIYMCVSGKLPQIMSAKHVAIWRLVCVVSEMWQLNMTFRINPFEGHTRKLPVDLDEGNEG